MISSLNPHNFHYDVSVNGSQVFIELQPLFQAKNCISSCLAFIYVYIFLWNLKVQTQKLIISLSRTVYSNTIIYINTTMFLIF